MTIKYAVFAVGLLLTVLVLACTHYDKHGTVSLTCSRDGVWRKA